MGLRTFHLKPQKHLHWYAPLLCECDGEYIYKMRYGRNIFSFHVWNERTDGKRYGFKLSVVGITPYSGRSSGEFFYWRNVILLSESPPFRQSLRHSYNTNIIICIYNFIFDKYMFFYHIAELYLTLKKYNIFWHVIKFMQKKPKK